MEGPGELRASSIWRRWSRPVRLRPVCRAGKHLCGAATAQHAQRATNWPFVPL